MYILLIQSFIILQAEIDKSFGLLDKIADPVLALLLLSLGSGVFALWRQIQNKNQQITKLYDEKFTILRELQKERSEEVESLNANLLSISTSNQALIIEFKGIIKEFTERTKESTDLHRRNSDVLSQLGTKVDQLKNKRI